MILLFCVHMVWSDLCGQDRVLLADWFLHHGSPTLLEDPLPQYVDPPDSNPYDDPSNPPDDPNPGGKLTNQSSEFFWKTNQSWDLSNQLIMIQVSVAWCGLTTLTHLVTTNTGSGQSKLIQVIEVKIIWSETLPTRLSVKKRVLLWLIQVIVAHAPVFKILVSSTDQSQLSILQPITTHHLLGVYLRQNLTDPTRFCGALGIISHGLMTNCLQVILVSDWLTHNNTILSPEDRVLRQLYPHLGVQHWSNKTGVLGGNIITTVK